MVSLLALLLILLRIDKILRNILEYRFGRILYARIVDKYTTLNAMILFMSRHLNPIIINIGHILKTDISRINLMLHRNVFQLWVMLNGDFFLIENVSVVLYTDLIHVQSFRYVHTLIDLLEHTYTRELLIIIEVYSAEILKDRCGLNGNILHFLHLMIIKG